MRILKVKLVLGVALCMISDNNDVISDMILFVLFGVLNFKHSE